MSDQVLAITSHVIPDFSLKQNCPNPFNLYTRIEYQLRERNHVKLTIFNILGQKVKAWVDEWQRPGAKQVIWDGKDESGEDVASGVYLYRITAGGLTQSKKMVMLE